MPRLGPYQLEEELGRGAAGAVYRARGPGLERAVAVKVLASGRGATPARRERFLREGRALARLDHPAVVKVLDVGEDAGTPYLVMELVEGGSLAARLEREGPLPPGEALRLCQRLAEALAHAHAQGLVHRDVKPDNVLLRRSDGAPLLTDFGLVRELDRADGSTSLSRTGQFLGTPGYWAPEQARGEWDRLGPAADVYGLGALLYALLTGQPPHGEVASLAEAVVQAGEPVIPPSRLRPELPAALDALVLRCLAADPGQRYPSAWALASALGEARAAPRAAARGPSPRAARLAAATVLGGGVLAALLVMSRGGGATPAEEAARASPPAAEPARSPPGAESPATPAATPESRPPARPERAESRRWFEEANLAFEAGDLTTAEAGFARAIQLDPEFAVAWLNHGNVRAQQGDVPGAMSDYTRALELRPDLAQAVYNRGNLLAAMGRHREALDDFTRAVTLSPDLAGAWYNRGNSHLALEELEQALADYRRASELRPEHALTWVNLGAVRLELGDPSGALPCLDRALALEPDLLQALANRASVRELLGDLNGALADAERAAALLPDEPRLRALRDRLRQATR